MQTLSKLQIRLLRLASKQVVERRQNSNPFDMLQFLGLITSEGRITKDGQEWLRKYDEEQDNG